jgi:putative Ca2+/H+ antiporter (TMEM165/GDT1 family)
MLEIFLASFGAVFIAEIVGDKLLYTSGVLATRYRWGAVVTGMSLAFMGKMVVAVIVGAEIAHLLKPWQVAALAAVSFIGVAYTMWRKPDVRTPKEKDTRMLQGAMAAFATIFLSEWGDKGMVTAGLQAATWTTAAAGKGQIRSTVLMVVWAAAVMAMVVKGSLAITLGASAKQWIVDHVSPRHVRYLSVAALLVLGTLCVLEAYGLVD